MRAPVGGLFRHVADLSAAQTAAGHFVGIIADRSTGGEIAERTLAALDQSLALGVSRVPMNRHIGISDMDAVAHVSRRARTCEANVLHGHGAKGGAYARLAASSALRIYTPHGGSLHFAKSSPIGFAYLMAERFLLARTDAAIFESEFARTAYEQKVGKPRGIVRVVHNGVREIEFDPITADADAAGIVFVGELRMLKGVDVLLRALATLRETRPALRAVIVGDGPDRAGFTALAGELGLSEMVDFAGPMSARDAFARGKVVVVPSRAESLPYIVLEAAAAGMPLVATNVGGIPEIFGDDAGALVLPADPAALANSIADALDGKAADRTARLRQRISEKFTTMAMSEGVLAAYIGAKQHKLSR